MKNIMSVDLEDFFCDLPFSQWSNYDERVINNTEFILKLFDKYNVSATFFTLGYIADKHPELIEKIVSDGHEIASHSYYHCDIRNMNKDDFEQDLKKSLESLEKISGEKINGFRAPFFSIDKNNLWVFDVLKKYLKYDSSIFPVKTPLYGISNGPTQIYHVADINPLEEDTTTNFVEIPMSILKIPMIGKIPIAGGFHLRFLPLFLQKIGIRKQNKKNLPASCYIHPKDLDPQMPKISEYAWHYYWGLDGARNKFESLLKSFEFSSIREIIKI
tara:strand:+ start:236 stop:1054 length:819 start_codon:yes stop_codon:yes gene_type:complete